MNAKKFIVAAVLGTVVTVAASTQTATAAPWRRPIYHGPVYGSYWHRPYYYGGYNVVVPPAPVVYDYAAVPTPAPCYTNGVYVGLPRVNVRVR
jgi:hypothetical protein